MHRAYWLTCFWPGLSQLWIKGRLSGLLSALLFAGLLNMALLSHLVWPELLPAVVAWSLWPLVAGFWLHGLLQSCRQLPKMKVATATSKTSKETDIHKDSHEPDLFTEAQQEYMKQNWYEAETLLLQLLRDCETDLQSRLMLASLYRRTDRLEEAEAELKRTRRMEGSHHWNHEIQQVDQQVRQQQETNQDGPSHNQDKLQPAA